MCFWTAAGPSIEHTHINKLKRGSDARNRQQQLDDGSASGLSEVGAE